MKAVFNALLLCLCVTSAAHAGRPDFAANCLSCHGERNSRLEYQAPQLKGLKKGYILQQLQNYRRGLRAHGSRAAEAMTAAVQQYDDRQLEDIASWAVSLDGDPRLFYAKDSTDPGAVIFVEQCRGCHESFMGRLMTGSPQLDYLSGEYMTAQLDQFRSGERSILEPGKHQVKMVAVVKALDEQQLRALKAFLMEHTHEVDE